MEVYALRCFCGKKQTQYATKHRNMQRIIGAQYHVKSLIPSWSSTSHILILCWNWCNVFNSVSVSERLWVHVQVLISIKLFCALRILFLFKGSLSQILSILIALSSKMQHSVWTKSLEKVVSLWWRGTSLLLYVNFGFIQQAFIGLLYSNNYPCIK